MSANLTYKYLKAEEAYRGATTLDDELRCLQVMLRELPKHKGTDKLHADLKQRISRTKQTLAQQQSRGLGKSAAQRIPRQGAGRVVVIGGPNVGKSQLLASLTRATPEIAPYPFTTRSPAPGMMRWEDILIQVIDTPPITAELLDPVTLSLIRGADLVIVVADLGSDEGLDQLQDLLGHLQSTKTRLAATSYLDKEDLGCAYTQTLLVWNKIDLPEAADRLSLWREFHTPNFPEHVISAQQANTLDELRQAIFESLRIVRIYTKLPSEKQPDYDRPFTVNEGATLLDVAELVHQDFARNLKYARVWREEVHAGAVVHGDFVLRDKDVIELHL